MNIKKLTKEEIKEIPLVEIAYEIMKEEGKPFNYYDLFETVSTLKGLSKKETEKRIAKLYTDINIDGRFHSLGDNQWGLNSWYPFDQTEEEITTPIKKKKKAKDVHEDEDEDDFDFDEYEEEDEYEDLEDELDEISGEEDADDEKDKEDFDDKEELEELADEELEDEEFDDEDEEG